MKPSLTELCEVAERIRLSNEQIARAVDPLDSEEFDTPAGLCLLEARHHMRCAIEDVERQRVDRARDELAKALAALERIPDAEAAE